ncbi:MAG TPA: aminopeptidase [Clostridiales bacterium]|nr:aminopeptidase [Clostridiales bacterium]
MDNRVQQLASNLLNHSVKLKAGEKILIEMFGTDCVDLANELISQSKEIGAIPLFNIIDYKVLKELLLNCTEQQIKTYAKYDLVKMQDVDAYIGIRSQSIKDLNGISNESMEIYNKLYQTPVHFNERVKNTKWCILRYPNDQMAKMAKMSLEDFTEFYYDVCTMNYDKMEKAMETLKTLLDKTDKVHIIGPGTDLEFSVKGIPAEKYYGTFNIPDGEVASCPTKYSANGYITYNTETTYNGITFKNIYFELKDGKIIKAEAGKKTKELNEILDTDEGARYIGEFALGLNPYIENVMGDILFDEKICGSFHFTPGDALEESDNGNRSSIHWDIVCIQTPEYGGGEIYFDDVLVRKNGIFVLPELVQLNPEVLKDNDM